MEKREHAVPRTQSSIYSHGVVIVECVEELHNRKALYVAASDITTYINLMTDWVSWCKYALPHCHYKVQSGPHHVVRTTLDSQPNRHTNLKPFRGRPPLRKRRKALNAPIPTAIPYTSGQVEFAVDMRADIPLYPLSSAPSDGLAICLMIAWGYLETASMENQSRTYR